MHTPPDPEAVWARIQQHAGEEFKLLRGQSFTYEITGKRLQPSTMKNPISRGAFERGLEFVPIYSTVVIQHIQSAGYVAAILMDRRIRASEW